MRETGLKALGESPAGASRATSKRPERRTNEDAPVLIAGGGLVGLCAAMFLAQRGVRCIAIERLRDISPLPRAAFFHMRTLEMFRAAGIESIVREQSAKEFVPEGAIVAMDCLSGRVLANIIGNLNEGVEAVSPCRRLFLNQPSLEPILRERARAAGATVLQGAEVQDLRQSASEVSVRVKDVDGGKERTLRGRYLVAADGAHSKVRELLGVRYEGHGAFSNSLTIYFQADVSPWIGEHAWSIIYVNNPTLGGFFRLNRAASAGFLAINTVGDPAIDPQAATNVSADLTEQRLIELVRAAVGVADLDVRIDGFTRWRATALVAQRFREGRIFLAGDAAHLMPPNGGFGGNTGIHDVHNLAWKLALVLEGVAHPRLLETYESERMPVARFTVEQAFTRYVQRTAPWLQARERSEPLAPDFQIEFGYLYDSPRGVQADPSTTLGEPGARIPHLWLMRGSERVSTLDLAGRFLVLAAPEGSTWMEAAPRVAERLGLALEAYRIGSDLADPDGRFCPSFGVTSRGVSLVRPDGYIAWRSPAAVDDPEHALESALSSVLAL